MKSEPKMIVSGIKCDKPLCDYRDDDVAFEEYGEWVNKPCPKCQSNLLTKRDYFGVRMAMKLFNLAHKTYVTNDGTTFLDKKDAIKYEKNKNSLNTYWKL